VERERIAALARLIEERQPCVVLTGAGVSTESGIPDFRSPTGMWARLDPSEYATIEAFRTDPAKVWTFYGPRIGMLTGAAPNAAHLAIAELERRGLVEGVVTQNIDLLHERAGSRAVVEVHGSIRTFTCLQCGGGYDLPHVLRLLEPSSGEPPRCSSCAAVLKPDVVFFGELMPERALDEAYALARAAGLLLVVGSTLEVWPVADLPAETLRRGGALAVVNLGPTAYDSRADLRIEGSAGEILPAVVDAL
jgi:NAD-dependent deacetylase